MTELRGCEIPLANTPCGACGGEPAWEFEVGVLCPGCYAHGALPNPKVVALASNTILPTSGKRLTRQHLEADVQTQIVDADLARGISESQLQDAVVKLATLAGWLVHAEHVAMSNKGWRTPIQGHKGFPDLVLVRSSRVIFAECKSERGRLTEEQMQWINWLEGTGKVSPVYIWRPSDWLSGDIEIVLRQPGESCTGG